MFQIDEDMTIHVTRGDIAFFSVSAETNGILYKFRRGDIVRVKVFDKKNCSNVAFQKNFLVEEECERVNIFLSEEETKIGDVISKPKDYWYEIELNPYTNPQTIVCYDDDGPKIFKLYPEGRDIPSETAEEDIPVVDRELSMTSTRPVENQAVTRALVRLGDKINNANASVGGNTGGNMGGIVSLTSTQVKALNEMFKVCAYSKTDISAEYENFKKEFGLGGQTPTVPAVIPAVSVTLSDISVTFNMRGARTITATVNPTNTTDELVWSSSDESVATVTNGVIKSVSNGTAIITARAGNVYAICNVTVDVAEIEFRTLTGIGAVYSGGSVEVGSSLDELKNNLVVTANYSDGSTSTVNDYTLSGSIGTGNNIITVTYWEKTATFTVTGVAAPEEPKEIPATKITLNKAEIEITDDTSVQLTATVEPSNTTDAFVWTSDNEDVAVVTDGLVKPISNGTAVITARAGDVSATCDVKVNIAEEVVVTLTGITATYSGGDADVGTTILDLKKDIVVTAEYSDGSTSTVNNYAISGSNIKLGDNTITISYSGKSTSFIVKGVNPVVPATKVTLNKTSVEIKDMSSVQLTATVEPSDTTDTVVWTSDREDVATVTNGLVKPIAPGSAIIRATAGNVYALCYVDVVAKEEEVVTLTGVTADYTGGSMPVGSTISSITGLTVTANYSDGTTATVYDYTLSGEIKRGSNIITVAYQGHTTTFTVPGSDGDFVFETAPFIFRTSGKNLVGGSTWNGQSIYYADAIENKDGAVTLVGSSSVKLYKTTHESYDVSKYDVFKGKYVGAGTVSGTIYFVEENATYSIETESSMTLGTHEKVTYTPAYKVTVKGD